MVVKFMVIYYGRIRQKSQKKKQIQDPHRIHGSAPQPGMFDAIGFGQ